MRNGVSHKLLILLLLLLFVSIESFSLPCRFHFRDRTLQLNDRESFTSLQCSNDDDINKKGVDFHSKKIGDKHNSNDKKTELVKNWKKLHNFEAVNMHIVNKNN